MPRRLETITIPLNQLAGFEGVNTLARLIRTWERGSKQNTYKVLAKRAGLLPVTVARIASRESKQPRLQTCIMIFVALGFVAARMEYSDET